MDRHRRNRRVEVMRKLTKLPREEAGGTRDGLPVEGDVEAHGIGPGGTFSPRLPGTGGDFSPRLPGTGGDVHRPATGGELTDDDDVEAHGMSSPQDGFSPRLPGTGGDAIRRPIGTGDRARDDIEADPAS
jgi:hypothetical protein